MNKALYFLLGAVVGGAGSYIYFKNRADKLEKAYNESREYLELKAGQKDEEEKAPVEIPIQVEEVKEVKETTTTGLLFDDPDAEDEGVSYDKAFKHDEAQVPKINVAPQPVKKGGRKKTFQIISVNEFLTNPQPDQKNLTYFSDGDTFMDTDTGEMLPEGIDWVGRECLNHFGDDPDEPGVVYVRNNRRGCDYEVVLNEDICYEDYVADMR